MKQETTGFWDAVASSAGHMQTTCTWLVAPATPTPHALSDAQPTVSKHRRILLEKLPLIDHRHQTVRVTTHWKPPLPLASAAPRRKLRRASSQLMTSRLKATKTAINQRSQDAT